MRKRAVWRPHPDDPRHALGWFLADTSPRRLSVPVATSLMILIGGASVCWTPWMLLFVPALLLNVRLPERSTDVGTLATVPPPGPCFLATVELMRDGVMYGEDQGVVTFIDGWLHFAGHRTEFSLSRAGGRRLTGQEVQYGDEIFKFKVERGIEASGAVYETDRFARAMGLWFNTTTAPEGESVLPPREVHPTGPARAWREILVPLSLGVPLFVLFLVFFPTASMVAIGLFPVNISSLRNLRRQALEDRRRALTARSEA